MIVAKSYRHLRAYYCVILIGSSLIRIGTLPAQAAVLPTAHSLIEKGAIGLPSNDCILGPSGEILGRFKLEYKPVSKANDHKPVPFIVPGLAKKKRMLL